MKKISLYSVLFVLVLVFVSCTKTDKESTTTMNIADKSIENTICSVQNGNVQPEDGAHLVVWMDKESLAFMEKMGEVFTSQCGVPVEFLSTSVTEVIGKLATDASPESGAADVFLFMHDRLGDGLNAGVLAKNLINGDEIRENMVNDAVLAVSKDNDLYGWPMWIETVVLAYNKNIYQDPPQTYTELLEKGLAFTDKKNNNYGFLFQPGNFYFAFSFLSAGNNSYIFGDNDTNPYDIGLNNESAVAGLREMLKLRTISIDNSGEAESGQIIMGLFSEGKAGAILAGSWDITNLKKLDIPVGLAPLPLLKDAYPRPFLGVKSIGVNQYSNYPRAAQILARYLSSEMVLLESYRALGLIPAIKSALDDPEIASDSWVAPFLEQARHAYPMPHISEMNYVWTAAAAAFSDAWDGNLTPQEAMDKAVQTIADGIRAGSSNN